MRLAASASRTLPGLCVALLAATLHVHAAIEEASVNFPHLILAPGLGEILTLKIPGHPAGQETSLTVTWPDGRKEQAKVAINAQGEASFPVKTPDGMKPGEFQVALAAPAGVTVQVTGDVMPPDDYARADELAKSVHLKQLVRILFLGDSLTAQRAGSNQVDKLRFWLEKYNPGRTTVRNAAVGGDSIRLVTRRLQHMQDPGSRPAQHRQETYDDLFGFQPDLIFIALGQNDTKVSSVSGYKETNISPEEWESGFARTLDTLAQNTKAQVVLISSISPVEEICWRRAKGRADEGREHMLFGKPEAMEAFNTFLKSLAEKRDLAFCDFYTPTKTHPAKATLFQPVDGLHLTLEGNRFLAEQYLRYFAAHAQ